MITLEEAQKLNLPNLDPEMPKAVISFYSDSVKVVFPRDGVIRWVAPEQIAQIFAKHYTMITCGLDLVTPTLIGKVFRKRRQKLRYLKGTSGSKKQSITVLLPDLLLIGTKNKEFYLFALETSRLTEDTTLDHPELPNVYSSGKMCFGDTVNQVPFPKTAEDLENAFEIFFSNFFTDRPPGKIRFQTPVGSLSEVIAKIQSGGVS